MDRCLKSQDCINWFKKRYERSNIVKNEYLHTKDQLEKHYEIERCFNKFDADNSGTLDFQEIKEMLRTLDLKLTKQGLDFKDFKKFIMSEEGNKAFKNVIKDKVSATTESSTNQTFGSSSSKVKKQYIPCDFKTMLEFIDLKIKRESAIK